MSWLIIWLALTAAAGTAIVLIRRRNRRRSRGSEDSASSWRWVERGGWIAGIVSAATAVWTLVSPSTSNSEPPQRPQEQSSVVASSDGYLLRPCSWIVLCNDGDKVDLDTGQPGYGSSSIQLGPAREGGPAEVIVEDDHIHGSDRTARYVIAPSTTSGAADCRNLLEQRKYRRLEISLDDLHQGAQLCVETNEKHVALVSVMRVSFDPVELEIAFSTWKV